MVVEQVDKGLILFTRFVVQDEDTFMFTHSKKYCQEIILTAKWQKARNTSESKKTSPYEKENCSS